MNITHQAVRILAGASATCMLVPLCGDPARACWQPCRPVGLRPLARLNSTENNFYDSKRPHNPKKGARLSLATLPVRELCQLAQHL